MRKPPPCISTSKRPMGLGPGAPGNPEVLGARTFHASTAAASAPPVDTANVVPRCAWHTHARRASQAFGQSRQHILTHTRITRRSQGTPLLTAKFPLQHLPTASPQKRTVAPHSRRQTNTALYQSPSSTAENCGEPNARLASRIFVRRLHSAYDETPDFGESGGVRDTAEIIGGDAGRRKRRDMRRTPPRGSATVDGSALLCSAHLPEITKKYHTVSLASKSFAELRT